MTTTDEVVDSNADYANSFSNSGLGLPPARQVAIVACMDARLDVYRLAGLDLGQAHVIRNAGGVVTDDVIRSLILSQRLLGTTEIVLIHHTDCGMLTFSDEDVKDAIATDAVVRPPFAFEAFSDLDQDIRQSLARIEVSPYLQHKNARGFVYDVNTGGLREVLSD